MGKEIHETVVFGDDDVNIHVIEVSQGVLGESAYEIAVRYGYEGTEEEWNSAVNANRVLSEQARDAAIQAKDDTQQIADQALADIGTLRVQALNDILTDKNGAIQEITNERTAALSAINQAHTTALAEISNAQTAGTQAVVDARDAAVIVINSLIQDAESARDIAVVAKDTAVGAADTATTQAGIATTSANTATTEAGRSKDEADRAAGYADAMANGIAFLGLWDASNNTLPTKPDMGAAQWKISVSGVLNGHPVNEGDTLIYSNVDDVFLFLDTRNQITSVNGRLGAVTGLAELSQISPVGLSGDYNDLANRPTFATVATSGSYNDLSNLPDLSGISQNANAITRNEAEKKLERNSAFSADFAGGKYSEVEDYSGRSARDLSQIIDVTAEDGVSTVTADGRVVFAPANTAALSWNEGRAVGLVCAPASTNLLTESEDIKGSGWAFAGASNFTVFQSANDSPITRSGQPVKFQRVESINSDSFGHNLRQFKDVVQGEIYSTSIYVSDDFNLQRYLVLWCAGERIIFDIQTKTFSSTSGFSLFEYEKLKGGGRVKVSRIADSTGSAEFGCIFNEVFTIGTNTNHTQGAYSEVVGFQVEQGYPTPYIKTEASQVTRGSASAISNSLPNLSERQGTIYAEFTRSLIGNFSTAVGFGNESNDQLMISNGSAGPLRLDVRTNLVSPDGSFIITDNQAPPAGGLIKTVATYERQPNGNYLYRWYVNGRFVGEDTLPRLPNGFFTNPIGIGQRRGNSNTLHHLGTIASVKTAPVLLSQAEAIALTTLEG